MHQQSEVIKRYDIWLIIATLVAMVCLAFLSLQLLPTQQSHESTFSIQHLSTTDRELGFDTILHLPESEWKVISPPINLGLDSTIHWFSFVVPDDLFSDGNLLLQIDSPLVDSVSAAYYSDTNLTPNTIYRSGDALPFSLRPIEHSSTVFPIYGNDRPNRIILRMETSSAAHLPMRLWNEKDFIEYNSKRRLVLGVFFGFLAAMVLGYLFICLTTGCAAFAFFTGYLVCIVLTLLTVHGIGYAYLWSDLAWFQSRAATLLGNLAMMFAILFTRFMLATDRLHIAVARLFKWAVWLFGALAIVSFVIPNNVALRLSLSLLAMGGALLLFTGLYKATKGDITARYLTLSWLFLVVSVVLEALDTMGTIKLSIPTSHLMLIGVVLQTTILTLLASMRYARSRHTLLATEQRVLEQEQQAVKAKEELLEAQRLHRDELEYKVEERTLELEITLRELSEANRELERLTEIDPLTGINNRRHFDKRLKNESRRSRREQTPLSLAVLDIDHFKRVNDQYGHDAGDACLRHVAKLLKGMLHRSTDDLSRIGGEEFAIILPNTDKEGAFHVLESMRAALEASPVQYEHHVINITTSAGIATTMIVDEGQYHTLFRTADEQLYEAKRAGRNQIVCINLS